MIDALYCESLYAAYKALLVEQLSPEAGKEITSTTINGESFSGTLTDTAQARIAIMERAISYVEAGAVPSQTARVIFS